MRTLKSLFVLFTFYFLIGCGTVNDYINNNETPKNTELNRTKITMPVQQVIIYESQIDLYNFFNAAIFAQGQLPESAKLPLGSDIALYVDSDKVNGPMGLQNGMPCNSNQENIDYYKNTITMDRRFCPDINNAILQGTPVYGLIPTEEVFLHKQNGERCWGEGNGAAFYIINPASEFYRNYITKRSAEKLTKFGVKVLFLDNIQNGWAAIKERCNGNPAEYPDMNIYDQMYVGMVEYIKENLINFEVRGNLSSADPEAWDRYSFLDGAMCENCFSNWGGALPDSSRMLSDLRVMDKWVNQYEKMVYIVVQPPDVSEQLNRFAFAASLLISSPNAVKVYFHFGGNYGDFYSIPEYQYNIGAPVNQYQCVKMVCARAFENGTVKVDFNKYKGVILLK